MSDQERSELTAALGSMQQENYKLREALQYLRGYLAEKGPTCDAAVTVIEGVLAGKLAILKDGR